MAEHGDAKLSLIHRFQHNSLTTWVSNTNYKHPQAFWNKNCFCFQPDEIICPHFQFNKHHPQQVQELRYREFILADMDEQH